MGIRSLISAEVRFIRVLKRSIALKTTLPLLQSVTLASASAEEIWLCASGLAIPSENYYDNINTERFCFAVFRPPHISLQIFPMGRASKDKRDIYYRKAKALGYRARSAFKLEQLDQQCDLLSNATKIVDLCAAPGSWSQYIARRLKDLGRLEESRVIAIDLQEMAPIEGVKMLQADITKRSTLDQIRSYFGDTAADIVLSDGAPDVTGLHDIDEYVQAQLVLAALNVASQMLRPGGSFVAKVFRQKDTDLLYSQLRIFFPDVTVVKPRSSRNSSIESFVVCRNYRPLDGFIPVIVSGDVTKNRESESLSDVNRMAVPFISAGDLSGLDANMSYSLDVQISGLNIDGEEVSSTQSRDTKYVSLPPVVPPIQPPYAEAIRRQRHFPQKNETQSQTDRERK